MNVIQVDGVSKNYVVRKKRNKEVIAAVNNLSFSIKKGEIFGLLGPNGAGKTTTIKMLISLLKPTTGRITVLGHDVEKEDKLIKDKMNFMFGGERGLYERLTLREYLLYFSVLYKLDNSTSEQRINNLIKQVGLETNENQKIYTFSKGMKQRVHLARCLLNKPKVIFLDEPTIGLDPIAAKKIRNIIKDLAKKEDITILITTHYMAEAEEMCDRIAIIYSGELKVLDTPDNIKINHFSKHIYELVCNVDYLENFKLVYRDANYHSIQKVNEKIYTILFQSNEELSESDLKRIGPLLSFKKKPVSLEDAYTNIIGSGDNND